MMNVLFSSLAGPSTHLPAAVLPLSEFFTKPFAHSTEFGDSVIFFPHIQRTDRPFEFHFLPPCWVKQEEHWCVSTIVPRSACHPIRPNGPTCSHFSIFHSQQYLRTKVAKITTDMDESNWIWAWRNCRVNCGEAAKMRERESVRARARVCTCACIWVHTGVSFSKASDSMVQNTSWQQKSPPQVISPPRRWLS